MDVLEKVQDIVKAASDKTSEIIEVSRLKAVLVSPIVRPAFTAKLLALAKFRAAAHTVTLLCLLRFLLHLTC